jgi:Tol biopolymer transport system component
LSVNTTFNESHGRVSPDGRWLAYVTDQSGRDEVWIAMLPSCETRRQVSTAGGTAPEWSEGSQELFYLSLDRNVMAATISGQNGVQIDQHALFRMPNLIAEGRVLMPTSNNYLATRAGQRFLAAVSAPDANAPPISVVVNWPTALNRDGRSQ